MRLRIGREKGLTNEERAKPCAGKHVTTPSQVLGNPWRGFLENRSCVCALTHLCSAPVCSFRKIGS